MVIRKADISDKGGSAFWFFYIFLIYSRVRNEPNASLLALGDCARVKYPTLGAKLAKEPKGSFRETKSCPVALLRGIWLILYYYAAGNFFAGVSGRL